MRAQLAGLVGSEPVVANPDGAPCATDSRALATVQPVGSLTVTAPRADTRRVAGVIAGSSSVASASVNLAGVAISVGVVEANQVSACLNGATVASGGSRVDDLVVGGVAVSIIGDQPLDLNLGVARVRANQLSGTTRQALILDVAGSQIVLGEASASGDACAPVGGGTGVAPGPGGGPAGGQICPTGAIYDVAGNVCVIRESAGGGIDGLQETIVIGRPFDGPAGGSVLSLDEALQRARDGALPRSSCLRGRGPDYVVLGTQAADRITGANTADRILALGGSDRVSSGLGDDCVDGGTGNDRLTGDNDDDRLYGGAGRDRISGSADKDRIYGQGSRDVIDGGGSNDRLSGGSGGDSLNGGSGTDRLLAGSGADTINTGYGRDTVSAGSGRDAINAATAGPASKRIDCGRSRDRLRINRNERRRHRRCEVVSVIR